MTLVTPRRKAAGGTRSGRGGPHRSALVSVDVIDSVSASSVSAGSDSTDSPTAGSDTLTVSRSEHDAPRKWSPGGCVWCGSREDVQDFANEPRCADCREHESTIDAARRFLGMYGLRPLGGAVTSDDEEELEHRTAARSARAALERVRLPKRPAAADVRKSSSRAGAASTLRPAHPPTSASRTAGPAPRAAATRSTPPAGSVTGVDVAALADRVAGLLDQLSAIDAGIADAEASSGLPARARLSDLTRQRATVMTTLAALEKARRGVTG